MSTWSTAALIFRESRRKYRSGRAAGCVRALTRGPIRPARELSLAETVVSDTRRPPTSRRDHAGSTLERLRRLCDFLQLAPRAPDLPLWGVNETADILEAKKALRARIKAWRAGLAGRRRWRAPPTRSPRMGSGSCSLRRRAPIVSGFSSLPDEFRAWPLLRRLHGEGHALAMPVMQGKGKPLVFRAWAPGDAMDKAVWGIAEPKADKPALEPDIVLVPLLAFDAAGWRLGYGGGYYDRTLRGLRARKTIVAVGIAYDEQPSRRGAASRL